MFKGIVSLFTSGVIFSPFVLLGIISGSWCYFNMQPEKIRSLLLKKEIYVIVALASSVFVCLFAKVYDNGGKYIDWSAIGRDEEINGSWNYSSMFESFIRVW